MLGMTVRSFLREPQRPLVFVPVYVGYERLIEGRTYIDELSGGSKEKESVWGCCARPRAAEPLRQGAREPGEPILLILLTRHAPEWTRRRPDTTKSRRG